MNLAKSMLSGTRTNRHSPGVLTIQLPIKKTIRATQTIKLVYWQREMILSTPLTISNVIRVLPIVDIFT
jgi:hypothetical protein